MEHQGQQLFSSAGRTAAGSPDQVSRIAATAGRLMVEGPFPLLGSGLSNPSPVHARQTKGSLVEV